MNRYQLRHTLLKQSLLVLAISSWVFCSFIFATRPSQKTGVANPLTQLVRLPASIPTRLAPDVTNAMTPIQMDVVQLGCWDKSDADVHTTSARWVRLTGEACEAVGSVTALKNLANGYTGTVFDETHKLSSDYIPLQKGKNQILIRFEEGPGVSSESQFTFIRQ